MVIASGSALQTALGSTLVIAPHADDEVLGAGGTIAALSAAGCDVRVAIVTEGKPPAYAPASVEQVKREALRAHGMLGVRATDWLGFPAAGLAEVPVADLNRAIIEVVDRYRPKTLLVPFVGDMHIDHQIVFSAALVAARPLGDTYPSLILAYETLSESNWNAPYVSPGFIPNLFIGIEQHIDAKIAAMEAYSSQLRRSPHERSLQALRALAVLRGATVFKTAAEAFVIIRQVL